MKKTPSPEEPALSPIYDLPIDLDVIDFRHLTAFQKVYLERSYANAGHSLLTTRKSILRMMENLERAFHCSLFHGTERGLLTPSPFAERLFNDLRFLDSTRRRLMNHISAIHQEGRILHISSTLSVFRTHSFRNLFRQIQSLEGIRLSYSPVDSSDVAKELTSGHCDLYIGCWAGHEKRFVTQDAGEVPFGLYTPLKGRRGGQESSPAGSAAYIVALDGKTPDPPALPRRGSRWLPLSEADWLHWLNHPSQCAEGTLIYAPEASMDPSSWMPCGDPGAEPTRLPLRISYLHQHPYEFLPTLVSRLHLCTSPR